VAVAAVITDTITVSGSGFDAITNIQLRGADGKNYDTTTFTFTNSGSIGFKIGTLATGQAANRPFKVVVTNGAGLSATSSTTLGLGGVTWSSPAASSINEFPLGISTSLTLSASDGVGGSAVTYTLQSGSYLSGTFTLSGSTITGTTNAAENTTSSVTIRATDNADSSVFLDRTFTLKAVTAELYAFSSPFTFTSAGVAGRTGPTLTQLRAAYSPAWTDYTSNLNVTTQGIQEWTVPKTGTYQIEAFGARGGTSTGGISGKGARMRGNFTLVKGAIIKILCGQPGYGHGASTCDSGGGGGTFVIKTPYNTNPGSIMLIAGGGGGGGNTQNSGNPNASITTSGQNGSSGQAGGTGGSGGAQGHGASGAGFGGDGALPTWAGGSGFTVASRFTNGGIGGTSTNKSPQRFGGFGGGAGGHGNCCIGSGAGGGYSGGGGTDSCKDGAGGGSYNSGTSQSNSAGADSSDVGYVIVTLL
ncbi:MAG: hypothetical protein ACKVHS_09060, partial [Flavobacteriales bacterium]